MEIAHLTLFDVEPLIHRKHQIPAGIIGATISIDYAGSMWEGLKKTVIFRKCVPGCKHFPDDHDYYYSYKVEDTGDTVTIPEEAVNQPRVLLQVGVYGTDEEGKIAIPTIWADVGTVRDAAAPDLAFLTD